MPVPATFNGVVYQIPVQGDLNWAPPLTRYLVALAAGAISPSGGSYPLTADLNFGSSFGLVAPYYKSSSANISTAGVLRLSNTDSIGWRNFANSGNLLLGVNSSNQLTFNGTAVQPALTLLDGEIWIGNSSNLPIGRILSGAITTTNTGVTSLAANYITNAMVNSAAAIAYSKLNLTGSIVNADIFSGAAIAYSKLNLSNSIVNADVNTAAAIDATKIADGSVSSTEFQYLDGVTSSIQTQLNGKQASGNYITALTGDVTATGPGSVVATLATVNSNVGSFTLANITVNAKGLITAASNGSAGTGTVTNVSGTANQINVATGTTTPVISIANPLTLPGPMTAGGAIAMGTNKITGLGNGTAAQDAAAFGQIKLLQVVQATGVTTFTTTSTTFASSQVTASITPTSASNRIKVTIYTVGEVASTTVGANVKWTLDRGGNNLGDATEGFGYFNNLVTSAIANCPFPLAVLYIDSPATTSSTTYTLQLKVSGAGVTGYSDRLGSRWSIILEEVV